MRSPRVPTTLVAAAAAVALTVAPAHAHLGHTDDPGTSPGSTTPTGAHESGWEPLSPIAGGPRQEHAVAALGGKVYVLGGIRPGDAGGVTTVPDVEVYDPARGRWTTAAPLPVPMNHPNVAAVRGKLYVLGGLSGGSSWQALDDAFVYDPTRDEWTELPSLPDGVARGSAAMGVRGTTVYLAGGMRTLMPGPGGLQDTVDTVSAYDVSSGQWRSLPSLPQARDHVGGAVVGDTFYVLGGRDRGQVNVRDTVYAMDLRTGTWTERAPMPTPRGGIATAAVGTTIYTFGGEGNHAPGSDSVFAEVEAYETTHDRWRRLAPMPVPRHGTAAVTVGRTIHLPGGGTAGGGAPVAANDAFRPR